jgi:hypothetical protein
MTSDIASARPGMSLRDALRISHLMRRLSLNPAQAAALAGLIYGEAAE